MYTHHGHILDRRGSNADSSSQDSFTLSDVGDQGTRPNSHMSEALLRGASDDDDAFFSSGNGGSGNVSFFLVNSSPNNAKSVTESPTSPHSMPSKGGEGGGPPHLTLEGTSSNNNNNKNKNTCSRKRDSILTSVPENSGTTRNRSHTTLNCGCRTPPVHLLSSDQCISPSSQELSTIMSKNSGIVPTWLASSDLSYLHPHIAHSRKEIDLADVTEDLRKVAMQMRRYFLPNSESSLASDVSEDVATQLRDMAVADSNANYMSVLAEMNSQGSKGNVSLNGPSPALMQQYMGWWSREVGGGGGGGGNGASQTEASRPKALARFAPLINLLSGGSTENEEVLSSPPCSRHSSRGRESRNVLSDQSFQSCSFEEGVSAERQRRLSRNAAYGKRAVYSRLIQSFPADLDGLPLIKQESSVSFGTQDAAAQSSRLSVRSPAVTPLLAESSNNSTRRGRPNYSQVSLNDSSNHVSYSVEDTTSAGAEHTVSPLTKLEPIVSITSEEVVSLSAKKRRHSSHLRKNMEGSTFTATLLPHETPTFTAPLPSSLSRSVHSRDASFTHNSSMEGVHNVSMLPAKTQQPSAELTPVTALTSNHFSSPKVDGQRPRFVSGVRSKTPPKPKPLGGFFKRGTVGGPHEGTTIITGSGGNAQPPSMPFQPAPSPPLQPAARPLSRQGENGRGSSTSALEKSCMTPMPPPSILQKDARPRRNTVAVIQSPKSGDGSSSKGSSRVKR